MGFYDAFDDKPESDGPPPEIRHTNETTPYGQSALSAELDTLAQATEGIRNHALNAAAFAIYQLVETGHIARTDADEGIGRTARMIGLTPSEITKTMQSAARGGATKPRTNAPDPDAEIEAPPITILRAVPDDDTEPDVTPGDGTIAAWIEENAPILDFRSQWDAQHDEEWILRPLLPARRLVALYSPPKVGKSILMLELAAAIATGRDVLGEKTQQCKVLYVDFENDPIQDTIARLKKMGYQPDELDNLFITPFPTLSPMDSKIGGIELVEVAKYYGVDLIVIDTVSRAVKGEENSNDTWLSFYRNTGLLLKQAGIALIRLDHAGKDTTKGQRGGSAKVGDIDAVWRLDKIEDGESSVTLTLTCEAQRFHFKETFMTLTRRDDPLRHEVHANPNRAVMEAKIDACVEAMDRAGVPKITSAREAKDALRASGWRGRNDVIESALQRRGGTILDLDDHE